MKRFLHHFFFVAAVGILAADLLSASAADMSARIESVEKASNGVYLNFTVSGAPDFIDIEGSPTLTGIYREEQNVEIVTNSSGVLQAFLSITTDARFFRIRLLSAAVTNTLVLPIEAQNSFSDGGGIVFNRGIQQIYAGTEFAEAAADVIQIHGLAFRLEETTSSLNTTAPRLVIRAGLFRGSMLDLPYYGFIPLDSPATVVDRENVRLNAPAGRPPSVFDVQIMFDQPYTYDRRVGHLIVEVQRAPPAGYRLMDAASVSRERGWGYTENFPNRPPGGAGMFATKFFYTAANQ